MSVHPCCSVCAHRKVRSLLFLSHSRPPLVLLWPWLATSRPSRPSTRPLPTAVSGSCHGSSLPTYGEWIPPQMPGALSKSFFSLSCLFLHISCQLLNNFPFKILGWLLFPQNIFSTFCHQQKECTVSSLAGLVCQKPKKKNRPAFAKSSSVLCRMPRKSAD